MRIGRISAAAVALWLAAAGWNGSWAATHRLAVAAVNPAGRARDGISGNSVGRTGAHGTLGGPEIKPRALGAIVEKPRH